ncbi:MAG: hypothetical protein QG665_151 [Patescibacteria group bacterium]|nr:hypothetical protein [Patescibacteria group bacterium]
MLVVVIMAWLGLSGRSVDTVDNSDTASTSLRDLITTGKPVKCTFSTAKDGVESKGEVFVASNEKIRADFMTKIEGKDQVGHMIMKDKKVYVWLEGQAQGMTMSVPENSSNEQSGQMPLNFDDKDVSYDCDTWRVDEDKFTEPSGIKFSDLSAIVGGGAAAGVSANPAQCGACEQLSGAQKEQCKVALKCK